METWLAIVILIEVLITLFLVWGFLHEGDIILFEDLIIYHLKKFIKNVKITKK